VAQGRFGGKGKGDQRLCRFGRGLVYQRERKRERDGGRGGQKEKDERKRAAD